MTDKTIIKKEGNIIIGLPSNIHNYYKNTKPIKEGQINKRKKWKIK